VHELNFNKSTLQLCIDAQFKRKAIDYVLIYSPEELQQHGESAVQRKCHYGVLIEAQVGEKLCCIKKPIHITSYAQLTMLRTADILGVIQYNLYKRSDISCNYTVYYSRV